MARAPEPLNASAPSEERGLLTPGVAPGRAPRYSPERTLQEMSPWVPADSGELLPLGPAQNG